MTDTNATLAIKPDEAYLPGGQHIPQEWVRTPCKLIVTSIGGIIILHAGESIAINMTDKAARELVRALGRAGIWSDRIIPIMPNEEPDDPIGTEDAAAYNPAKLPF